MPFLSNAFDIWFLARFSGLFFRLFVTNLASSYSQSNDWMNILICKKKTQNWHRTLLKSLKLDSDLSVWRSHYQIKTQTQLNAKWFAHIKYSLVQLSTSHREADEERMTKLKFSSKRKYLNDYLPFSLIKFLSSNKQNDWQKSINFVMIFVGYFVESLKLDCWFK